MKLLNKKIASVAMLATVMAGSSSSALATANATMEDVDASFYPYRQSVPTFPGLSAGAVINQSNVDQFADVLDPAVFNFVKDGWTEIKVGETTSFDLHPNYVAATRVNLNEVSLGDQPGEIHNFIAGRPFPTEPDINDPRAGEKVAWNFKYGYNWGDNAAISPFYWKYRDMNSGKVERNIKFDFHFLNFMHRVNQEPTPEVQPNPSKLFRAIYVKANEPFDVKNTQLLIHRKQDDLQRDSSWLYLGFQRRVRKLASGQVTDAFLGSDIMIEDFEGYNGRISDMNWAFKGSKNLLLPFYNHNEMELADDLKERDGYQFVDFEGKGGCFPKITWQLRKVYELEATPVDKNHPISKRTHFVDAQTYTIPRTISYDRKGDMWKTFTIGQAHPDHHLEKNKGSGVSIDDSFSMVDIQASHCTTGQFKGQLDPEMNPRTKFSVQNLRASGR
jgi:hypothetical protein